MSKPRTLKAVCAVLVDAMVLIIYAIALPLLWTGEVVRRLLARRDNG